MNVDLQAVMKGRLIMSDSLGWIIVAFALYLLLMVGVGAMYAKKNNSTEDYFL